MPRYNETFELNVREIEYIENALRHEISSLANRMHQASDNTEVQHCEGKIKELHVLLGKLHNRKIWYGQVNPTGVPAG